jgi:bacterioferritin-associated ferredoxin
MIVCSCTLITSKDIAEAVVSLRSNDPFVVITPALIYRHLGKRPSCGNCLPLIAWATSTTSAVAPSATSKSEIGQLIAGL